MSILVKVCPYAKLRREDQRGNFYHAFKWLVFFCSIVFLFPYFFTITFSASIMSTFGPANILLFLQLSSIYGHILQDICLFKKGDINKMAIQTIVHLKSAISSNTLWHLATKQRGKQGDFLNQFP